MSVSSWAGCSTDFSSRSIITLTSSPVTVSVEVPGLVARRQLLVGDDAVHQHARHRR